MPRFGLLLLLFLPSAAWAGRHYIAGQVLDRNGEPVPRAQVKLTPDDVTKGTFQLVTDREGRFLIDYLRDEDGEQLKLARKTEYALEIWKPGFHEQSRRFFYKNRDAELEPITLTEETIQVEDQPTDIAGNLERTDTQSGGGSYEGQ